MKIYSIVVGHFYNSGSDPPNKSRTHPAPYSVVAVLSTVFLMLYFMPPWLFWNCRFVACAFQTCSVGEVHSRGSHLSRVGVWQPWLPPSHGGRHHEITSAWTEKQVRSKHCLPAENPLRPGLISFLTLFLAISDVSNHPVFWFILYSNGGGRVISLWNMSPD